MEEAKAYIAAQDLHQLLNTSVNQVVKEQPEDAAKRLGELLQKAAKVREDVVRMRALFSKADTSGNGFIDIDELRVFLQHMGEPLDEIELQAAFASIASENGVGFDSFSEWYQGARARGGALSRRGGQAVERKSRASRVSRASRASKEQAGAEEIDELAQSFDILGCKVATVGEPETLAFRVQLQYPDGGALLPEDGGSLKQISPWHDIPLYPPGGKAKVSRSQRKLEHLSCCDHHRTHRSFS